MALSEKTVKELSESIFSRKVLDDATPLIATEYQTVTAQFVNKVDALRESQQKELDSLLNSKNKPNKEQIAKIQKANEAKVDKLISVERGRFVAAYKREFIPKIDPKEFGEEIVGATGTGFLFGIASGTTSGGIMGALHHFALKMFAKAEPVQKLLLQTQLWARSNFFGDKDAKKLTWQEAGAEAEIQRTQVKMMELVGNDQDAAASMASVTEERAKELTATLKAMPAQSSVASKAQAEQGEEVAIAEGQEKANNVALTKRMDLLDGAEDGRLNLNAALLRHDKDKDGQLDLNEIRGEGDGKKQLNDEFRALLKQHGILTESKVETGLEYINVDVGAAPVTLNQSIPSTPPSDTMAKN